MTALVMDSSSARPFRCAMTACPFRPAQMLNSDAKPTSMWKSMPAYRIGRQDVANLLVAAMAHKKTARSTLSCSWGKDKKKEG